MGNGNGKSLTIIQTVSIGALLTIVTLLFGINRGNIVENTKRTLENKECLHELDKKVELLQQDVNHKLEILVLTLEQKYPDAVERAKEEIEKNGHDTLTMRTYRTDSL